MAVSGANWTIAWIGLELNILAFLPLLSEGKKRNAAEGGGKYFLAQAAGSLLFLFNPLIRVYFPAAGAPILFGLLVKAGRVPTHA